MAGTASSVSFGRMPRTRSAPDAQLRSHTTQALGSREADEYLKAREHVVSRVERLLATQHART